jgi:hypothetical protein
VVGEFEDGAFVETGADVEGAPVGKMVREFMR